MSGSPCAACKHLQQECTKYCVFAPYFPAHEAEKFAILHRIFDVSYVGKTLNQLSSSQRAKAVDALVFEANAWVRDPIYGSCRLVYNLQHLIKLLEQELFIVKKSQLVMRFARQHEQQMLENQQLREQQMLKVKQLREQWRKQQEELLRFKSRGGFDT